MNLEKITRPEGLYRDMDGVIYLGSQLLPGRAGICKLAERKRQAVSVPDGTRPSVRPRSCGRSCSAWDWISARSISTPARLRPPRFSKSRRPGCTAFVIGAPGLLNALYDVGVTMNDVDPDYVIVGETASYNYEVITKAAAAGSERCAAARHEFRRTGTDGVRPCAACRVARRAGRIGDGPEGLFYGQAEPRS